MQVKIPLVFAGAENCPCKIHCVYFCNAIVQDFPEKDLPLRFQRGGRYQLAACCLLVPLLYLGMGAAFFDL